MSRKINIEFLAEIIFYFIVLAFTLIFVYLRGQDRNWDLLNYHYYQGYFLLNGRFNVDIAAANLQSFFNPIANVLAYLSLTHLPFPFSAWSILAIQISSIPAIVLIAKEIGGALGYGMSFTRTIPAIILCLLAPAWGSELGTTFFSSWTAPLIIWGLWLIYTAYRADRILKLRILVAGMLFGLAIGLKLTNALFATSGLLMVAVLLVNHKNWPEVISGGAIFVVACVAGFSFTAWWNWYLWVNWGSPVFPLYNAIFKSEYYDLSNYRDMRWHFSSLQDFFSFVVQSSSGTGKTSEVAFADVRYAVVAVLLPAAILCRPKISLNRQLIAFLSFMISGFLLWVFMFAYQRYLIPIELLLGLLIWILVVYIVEKEWMRMTVMIGLALCAAWFIKVPDWGHASKAFGKNNPFSIEMNANLSATPARYVVVGLPISYVLPSFHPDSRFYGIDLSKQIDELVFKKLAEPSALPLRILSKDSDSTELPERLKRVGYDPVKHSLDCDYFKTGAGRYIVCEVQFQKLQSLGVHTIVNADFSESGYLNTKGILWERGLSRLESWGRWSDGDEIELGLTGCLPQGHLRLIIVGRAFGPNVGLPVNMVLAEKTMVANFTESDTEQSFQVNNDAICIDKLVVGIPKPISALEVGQSGDSRKLGIGLVSLKIIKE